MSRARLLRSFSTETASNAASATDAKLEAIAGDVNYLQGSSASIKVVYTTVVTAVVGVCAFGKVEAHKVEEQLKAQNGEIRQQGSKIDELAKEQSENFALLSKEIAVPQSQLQLLIGGLDIHVGKKDKNSRA